MHDAAEFDAEFFGISPREALVMDPQQRLLLETSWEAVERAGLDPASLRGTSTGVFVGVIDQDYGPRAQEAPESVGGYLMTGTLPAVASGRIAYSLGLEGPAVTVDTACSSSLVALHMAARSLRQGECELALAGGASVMATPDLFVEFSRQRGLSPDGRCRSFAAGADGTGWSEGAGVLLLERLSDARRRGHPVLAVLRGSAINSDGASNGLTAPSGPAQQRVIRAALAEAGLSAQDVDAVEAHGTATTLGDPIEAEALLATYGRDRTEPLWLGSLKSNIGHSQAAAGVGGVIKAVQSLRHAVLPATLHAEEPTPHVDWERGRVRLLSEARPWPEVDRPRRMAVSSFGVSGTNAHAILEACEPDAAVDPTPPVTVPVAVSGVSPQALRTQAARLLDHLDAHPDLGIADIALSTATTRAALEHRAVVVATEHAQLRAGLAAIAAGQDSPSVRVGAASGGEQRIAFLFAGQGSQQPGMGRELAERFPVFAEAFNEVCTALAAHGVTDPRRAVDLDPTDLAQPALFAFEVAMARLLMSWNVRPEVVAGHSVGEFAAAHLAGVFGLDDACRVIAARGRLMAALPAGGAMTAVGLPEDEVRPLLAGVVDIAAVNGPASVVISGAEADVAAVAELAAARGAKTKRLRVSHAFHSALVEPVLAEFREVVAGVRRNRPVLPVASGLTGELVTDELCDPDYWVRHARDAVRFADAVAAAESCEITAFVEIGPDGALSGMLDTTALVVPTARGGRAEVDSALGAAGALHTAGSDVDWTEVFAGTGAHRVDLPTYGFQRNRHWLEPVRPEPAADEVGARFWSAVDGARWTEIAEAIDVDADAPLSLALPKLAAWRKRADELSRTDRWCHRLEWRPLPEPPTARLSGTWLLLTAPGGTPADDAEAALSAAGAEVRRVELADADRADVLARITSMVPEQTGVAGVLSLAAAGGVEGGAPIGLARTAAVVQALGDAGIDAPLWCVTAGAVDVDGSGPPVPELAAVWGLGRVAALEHPERWGGLLDLGAESGRRAWRHVAAVLAGMGEDQVVLTPSGPAGARLVRAVPDAVAWRPRGTVLITGGSGALGAHVARSLAAAGAEHLVLVSRRGEQAPGAAELVAELSADGTRVTVAACDVADRDGLAALIAELPPTAVVHTAGVVDDGVLDGLTTARLADVRAPKATAAWHLHDLTRHLDLDAFVLFSSAAGVLGNAGQGNYAAANAELDALAQHRRAAGLPATSIAWGAWAGAGMAVDPVTAERLRRDGVRPMEPAEALSVLWRTVNSERAHALVADIDWAQLAAAVTVARPSPLLTDLAGAPASNGSAAAPEPTSAERLAEVEPGERARLLLEVVTETVAAVLGHEPGAVLADRAFIDLGFDSLTSVELRNRLAAATGLRLTATLAFDHPTPEALAGHLSELLVPAEPQADLVADLDRFAAAATGANDPDLRAGLAGRLRALAEQLAPAPATTTRDVLSASRDELFDLIDNDLGVSDR
ncbi:SDR family NAD(P)-dependent oxidoreductase [Saccharopolyspora indica]|nr:SDR family NAD(P)-dependent oxidoreductase [Saccharopolyspora indica]MDA3649394.1 SDR family NAD(P)-dependent oxidoreductase [Saccharopolyspora indica]